MMIQHEVMNQIGCSLAILTAREGNFDNGCVVNTVMQVATNPTRIAVSVLADGVTCGMIRRTGLLNLSLLSVRTPFAHIRQFGYQSGRDVKKTEGLSDALRTENGLFSLPFFANAILSGKVVQTLDLGSHVLFIAEIIEARKLADDPILTYDFYQKEIKPKTTASDPDVDVKPGRVAWRCVICGWIWVGEELPPDLICEICGHGAEDFEKIIL